MKVNLLFELDYPEKMIYLSIKERILGAIVGNIAAPIVMSILLYDKVSHI